MSDKKKNIIKKFSLIFSFLFLFITVKHLDVKANGTDPRDPYNYDLISITINGHRIIVPSSTTTQFNLDLPKSTVDDFLHVIAEPANEKAIISVEGNRLINDTAVIKIIVTSENKLSSYTYYVNVVLKDSEISGSFKDIKSAEYHNLALKKDGTLYSFGENSFGQLGDGTKTNRKSPVKVNNLSSVVDFDTSASHSIAVTSDGSVWVWGLNDNGQLDNKNRNDILTPMRLSGISGIIKVRAGNRFSLALDKYGSVWFMGYNAKGQYDDEVNTSNLKPRIVSALSNIKIKDIATGDFHCMALSTTGKLYTWGANDSGQLGDGTTNTIYNPSIVPNSEDDSFVNTNITYINANGSTSTCIKNDGTAYFWGKSSFYTEDKLLSPKKIKDIDITMDLTNLLELDVNSNHMVALKKDGRVFTLGKSSYGQLGTGTIDERSYFSEIYNIGRMNKIATSPYNTFFIGEDGYIYGCGRNHIGQLGIDVADSFYTFPKKIQSISGNNDIDMVYANYNSGEVDDGTQIKLFTDTQSAKIYYTLDGSDPTENSILYTSPINVKEYTLIKAVSVYNDKYSSVSTLEYFVSNKARTEMNINIASKSCKMGETIEIPITFSNISKYGVASAKFAIKFNPQVMNFDTVAYGELIQESGDFSYTTTQDKIILDFTDITKTSRNITQDGIFAVLKFYVKNNIPVGRYSITQAYVIDEGVFYKDDREINVYYNSGYIEVNGDIALYGDVDGDGVITARDLQYVQRYVAGEITEIPYYNSLKAADIDNDGSVTYSDIEMIKKLILK